MKKRLTVCKMMILSIIVLFFFMFSQSVMAQRTTDKLDRGLVAMKVTKGVYLSWRIQGEEYYDVFYNVYRDGVKINESPVRTSNYSDTAGSVNSKYTVSAIVRGVEQAQCAEVTPWSTSYKEIVLKHEGIKSTLVPNDACCADVDGDGEIDILMKFDNQSEIEQSFPKNGPKINGVDTKEYSIFECLKMDGTRLWWVNCGPNMGDFQNNEQNIIAYDWDGDGKAEAVMRAADGTTIHMANGKTYTVGNANLNYRGDTGGGTQWFMCQGAEYLVYMNGETGEPYQCITYPLKRLESGESDINAAWGDGYGHRCSKFFFGAPYLDGRKPSIFLARGIYTRHKMIAYDVDAASHTLKTRWTWYNNTNGVWKGQGYHNYSIADVDWDGRDEIVFGSMVIDDNGKGLSTTGLGHGDAHHVGNFNPYTHGQEIFACNEDRQGYNYRNATTSKIYKCILNVGNDVGRSMCDNFTDSYPGSIGTAYGDPISTVTYEPVSGMTGAGINQNFRIYWDGDLCSETFNLLSGQRNTEGCIAKYGSWTPIYTCVGSLTNNDTKATPCYQGDILGDWREEIIMRTANNNIRIYSTPTATAYRNYSLWHDHQYRNAMVWQMCGYNQPPHVSYFLGKLENITIAPPPLTMTDREEVANGGNIGSSLNDKHVIVCETGNTSITMDNEAKPYILTFNVPTWVQGSAGSESTSSNPTIKYTTYKCDVKSGSLAGEARLVKQGDGILNLPKADFTNTGNTDIWAGTVNFDGTLKNSSLWLNRFAELNSNGGVFRSIKADYASVIRPGGENSMGNITTDTLALGFGSRIMIDVYSNGLAADNINTKYLSIETKTTNVWKTAGPKYLKPVIELVPHYADGETSIKAGKYVIGEVSEISGSIDDIILEGIATAKKKIYIEDNKIIIEIFGVRDATTIEWKGDKNSTWDLAETENFLISNEATSFVSNDNVVFNDGASQKTIDIKGTVIPDSVIVNNTEDYTIGGEGNISGTAKFIKEGTGTVTITGNNSYTGGNHLKGGITKVSKLSNQYSETGNLGGITNKSTLFTIENGAELQTTAEIEMGSPIGIMGTEGGIINNSANFKMDASIYGTTLTKKGNGCLFLYASNPVNKIIMQSGSMALAANTQPGTIELQGGILYDDAQNTSHAINVPEGKSAEWHLSYTYYTAYSNKITGKGTLTIVPRNGVQRVRLLSDFSQFEGTIRHTNKNNRFPLDTSNGLAKGTLYVGSGCTVSNVCKTFAIGKLTGSGSLSEPVADFKSSNAVNGSNTWNVGNSFSENGDFTFDGTFVDGGGNNKCIVNKIGTCAMTVKGKWTNSGAVQVKAGKLIVDTGASLGSGALTVAEGAELFWVTGSSYSITNSAININGTFYVGKIATSTLSTVDAGNKAMTFGSKSTLHVGARKANTGTSATSGTTLKNVKTLTFNNGSKIDIYFGTSFEPAAGDELRFWLNVGSVTGTPTVTSNIEGLSFDTSKISEGIIIIKGDSEYFTNIDNIDADETVDVTVVTAAGTIVDSYTCPMGAVKSSLAGRPVAKGLYILNIKSASGKSGAIKTRKN